MIKKLAATALLIAGLFAIDLPTAFANVATAPDALVKAAASTVIEAIKTNRDTYATDRAALYELVNQEVVPHFDIERMARLVLGPAWRNADDGEKEQFQREFLRLLVRTYGTALLSYSNEELRYLPLQSAADATDVTMRTKVIRANGPPIAIDYRLYLKDDQWKVYDVSIEKVSLVLSYRGEYASIISREGLSALVARMTARNAKPVKPTK